MIDSHNFINSSLHKPSSHIKAFPLPSVTTLSLPSPSTAPAPTSSSSTLSVLKLLNRCTSSTLTGLPLRVCASLGRSPASVLAFTLLRLSVLVSAIGSESLLRCTREALAEAESEARVLALSRACEASGEIEREEEEAVVQGFGLRTTTERAELGVVLARWLEGGRCEGGAVGGGVGEASFGRTQERSCRGRAISSASSISASRSAAAPRCGGPRPARCGPGGCAAPSRPTSLGSSASRPRSPGAAPPGTARPRRC